MAPRLSSQLLGWFTMQSVDAGATVMLQGEVRDVFYVVESGELRATHVDAAGVEHQLRRFGARALLGEIGFFTNRPRTAGVVAVTDVELLCLSRPVYERLRSEQPELALELHDYVLIGQAERTVSLSDNLARALR